MSIFHDMWRQAALRDQLQFFGVYDPFDHVARFPFTFSRAREFAEGSFCALTIQSWGNAIGPLAVRMRMECPGGCGLMADRLISDWLVHLNNRHRWTWDMFANKFPEIPEVL